MTFAREAVNEARKHGEREGIDGEKKKTAHPIIRSTVRQPRVETRQREQTGMERNGTARHGTARHGTSRRSTTRRSYRTKENASNTER